MFDLSYLENGFRFVYPSLVYDSESLTSKLSNNRNVSSHELSESNDERRILSVQFSQLNGNLDETVIDLFSNINGLPAFDTSVLPTFRNASTPLISCVILLTANDLFVQNFLIPGIIKSSGDFPIEIIIVYNGCTCNMEPFKNLKVVRSLFGSVSKAYNTGIRQSRGKLVAIFHDDCIINDKNWIEKTFQELDSGAVAVTPEIQHSVEMGLTTAKNVPLVMYRKNFVKAGRYDQKYYAGLEDVDFTCKLLSTGKEIRKIDVGYFHFEGMSTTIMMSSEGKTLRQLYGLHMIPKSAISNIKSQLFFEKRFEMGLVTADSLLRIIKKFNSYLHSNGYSQLLQRKDQLRELVKNNRKHPLLRNRKGLINLYKMHLETH